MATASQPTDQPSQPVQPEQNLADDPSAAEICDLTSPSVPSDFDRRVYYAYHTGRTIRQLARSQHKTEAEINQSIFRVSLENERYSSLATGVETRKLYLSNISRISDAIGQALVATKLVGKKVVMIDKESGAEVVVEEQIERPDHQTRLQAVDTNRYLLAVVQPKDPAVSIVSNSQTNILNQGAQPAGQLGAGLTSPEAVIRSIVAARQNALTAGTPTTAAPSTILEGEHAMARDPDQPDGEYEDLDEPEDDDDDEEEDEDEDDEDDDDNAAGEDDA